MGAAAYNRGTALIRRQIDATQTSGDATLLRDLTKHSANKATVRIFEPTVVRFDGRGNAWLMHRARRGWGEYGVPFRTLWAIAGEYRLAFVGIGRDEHSQFVAVEPLP